MMRASFNEFEALLTLWGKARPAHDAVSNHHPLLYHCLDVAAVGEALIDRRPTLTLSLAERLGCAPGSVRTTLPFLLALHDIGKLSRGFQALVPELWPTILGTRPACLAAVRHDRLGVLLGDDMQAQLAELFPGWMTGDLTALLSPFLGHHGRPIERPRLDWQEHIGEAARRLVPAFIKVMGDIFGPVPMPRPERRALRITTWRLAGLAVLSDWIGSHQTWFPYVLPGLSPVDYLDRCARPRARRALAESGVTPARVVPGSSFHELTGSTYTPSAAQRWAEAVALPEGPCLAVIEDVTGSGKTEAALLLAQRLMARDRACGLYVALPTMATANAMFERLASSYRRLFADGEKPSLALAHGRRMLHEGFREVMEQALSSDGGCGSISDAELRGDGSSASCTSWLADDRRKAFLADVGAGTIDQALLAVLPARYQAMRLHGLTERVLIVDEAHAYDAYVSRELEALLEFQAALGGSAIVLSATLPKAIRAKLSLAFAKGLERDQQSLEVTGYPRVALVGRESIEERQLAARPALCREMAIERLGNADTAVAAIADAARRGAAVAWIRNTVDDALDGLAALRDARVDATLFHARFAMGDRLAIEEQVLRRWGKRGMGERAGVVVATQVIEQSLDLDFDLVVSDLAPVDLLLQRAGRLWRHERSTRPLSGPRLLVVSPDAVAEPVSDWYREAFPRAAWVYRDHAVVWRSARELFGRSKIRVPEDVPALIETVYATSATDEPRAFAANAQQAAGEAAAARSLAEANVLRAVKGYDGDHAGWDVDERVPTRLGEPVVVLRLARWDGLCLRPWDQTAEQRRAWALSEVTVRQRQIANVPAAVSEPLRQAINTVRAGWPQQDSAVLLLPLIASTDGSAEGWVLDSAAKMRRVTYSAHGGLRIEL